MSDTGGDSEAGFFETLTKDTGSGTWIVILLYLVTILTLGAVSNLRRKRAARFRGFTEQDDSLSHHYTASGSLGYFVLTLTLFATLFSGYTVSGVPSESYKNGFGAVRWISGSTCLAFGFAIMAPRIRRLSDMRGGYQSGADLISDRFRNHELRIAVAATQLISTLMYMMAQFRSMGLTLSGLSNGAIHPISGAVALAVILLVYESLGGMEAVAWTDVLQGFFLFTGFIFVLIVQENVFGGLKHATTYLASRPETVSMIQNPSSVAAVSWFSFCFILFPFMLYPHFLQRIYAAKTEHTLKTGMSILTIAPLLAFSSTIMLGIVGRAYTESEGLEIEAGEIFGTVMNRILNTGSSTNYFLGSIVLAASVAALMSTADSALLAISAISVIDFLRPYAFRGQNRSGHFMMWIGRLVSIFWTFIAVVLSLAVTIDLSALLVLQQNLMVQLAPSFVGGLFFKKARARPLFIGICVGWFICVVLQWGSNIVVASGIAPGIPALGFNLCFVIGLHYVDHPFFEEKFAEDEQWQIRFGEPLSKKYIGWKLDVLASEPLHHPRIFIYLCIIVVLFFTIPWYSPESIPTSLSGGVPGWAGASFICAMLCDFVISYGFLKFWEEQPPLNHQEELEMQSTNPKHEPSSTQTNGQMQENSQTFTTTDNDHENEHQQSSKTDDKPILEDIDVENAGSHAV